MHQKVLRTWPRAHFARFGKVWPMLTKFDQSWPVLTKFNRSLTKTMTKPKSRFDWPLSNHWKEHIKIRYFTGRKQTRNKGDMSKTVKFGPILSQIWLSIIDQKQAYSGSTFMHKVFSTHYELVCKFGTLRKRLTSTMTCNSWIAKSFSGQAEILIGKWLLIMKITLVTYVRKVVAHRPKLNSSWDLWHSEEDIMSFLETPKIIKNQHRELRQPCAGKLTKVWRLC